jgi:hypothetical protein
MLCMYVCIDEAHTPQGNPMIHVCACVRVLSCVCQVRMLLSAAAQLDRPDDYGRTPLYCAAANGHAEVGVCVCMYVCMYVYAIRL